MAYVRYYILKSMVVLMIFSMNTVSSVKREGLRVCPYAFPHQFEKPFQSATPMGKKSGWSIISDLKVEKIIISYGHGIRLHSMLLSPPIPVLTDRNSCWRARFGIGTAATTEKRKDDIRSSLHILQVNPMNKVLHFPVQSVSSSVKDEEVGCKSSAYQCLLDDAESQQHLLSA